MEKSAAVHVWIWLFIYERCGSAPFLGPSASDSPRHAWRGRCVSVGARYVRLSLRLICSRTICVFAESARPQHACNDRCSRRRVDHSDSVSFLVLCETYVVSVQ